MNKLNTPIAKGVLQETRKMYGDQVDIMFLKLIIIMAIIILIAIPMEEIGKIDILDKVLIGCLVFTCFMVLFYIYLNIAILPKV